ncbi:hypothetical protein MKZ20_09855 [Psychrobacillus sp. FSL K6-2684]|nr:hypothetical protein [Psychrobacillus sp. AK 1817]
MKKIFILSLITLTVLFSFGTSTFAAEEEAPRPTSTGDSNI